ncbi:PREDICTED: vesicular, overexpressed in cancer, prosurvival protein 1-like [Priapulus caudatus]|uniref:WW domain binding protein VOPP1 n=1 Tax=Priapulus caudatus TaxID=37621 RepID=A0ABM1EYJ1_PRICU|nr:PREDICTED: vesicular, overexpressed in cancer, prosurvival protein 1-like [Priapulus caudatus]
MIVFKVEGKLCKYFTYEGLVKRFYCTTYEYCCDTQCCTSGVSFYSLWYFWFCMLLMILICTGGGYWYKRRYYTQHYPSSLATISMFSGGSIPIRQTTTIYSTSGPTNHTMIHNGPRHASQQGCTLSQLAQPASHHTIYPPPMTSQPPIYIPQAPPYSYPGQAPPSYESLYKNQGLPAACP